MVDQVLLDTRVLYRAYLPMIGQHENEVHEGTSSQNIPHCKKLCSEEPSSNTRMRSHPTTRSSSSRLICASCGSSHERSFDVASRTSPMSVSIVRSAGAIDAYAACERSATRMRRSAYGAPVNAEAWKWEESLYAGSARHYGVGRMPCPPSLTETIRDELSLDGTGRLLDVGCGPDQLTLLLSPLFESAVGRCGEPGREPSRWARARVKRRSCDRTVSWVRNASLLHGERY